MNLPKVYEPGAYEEDVYALWERSGAFVPSTSGKTYSIVMPPPNANANLHIGYGLTAALEDIAARYHRLKGESVLLLPGADHAGFETQSVYEKHLAKEGKSRFDFSREDLYSQIFDFVALNRGSFESQMRKMGVGCDWSRFTFTLDDKIVHRAFATFKKMWDEGLIYRGERLVNYCTFHRTGFADVEVEHKEAKTPLYYIKYGPFELATTRPETKFGDTAVAVHPDDERYQQYVGTVITVDGVNGPFDVQVIADDFVDRNFGTGVVKITPAHSFDDWEVAQRHNLPAKRIINHDGTMNHLTGRFEGLTVMEARQAVAKAMEEQGMLIKVDNNYENRVGVCYKCGTTIEPMLMEQWFINMQPLAKRAIDVLEAGKITFYPEAKKDQLITYLKGLRDWNLSRQIAWGIPIPAFQNVDDHDDWIYDERVTEEIITVDGKTYHRDADVFDTWFSSSSWPFATLGYPDSDDFKRFYPLSLMETGGEILYPWVSRMIMLGLYVTNDIPFREVYIHGYVMAADGSKMSKSIGNVVDPLPVIEQYGSDALRLGIINGRAAAVNRGYDPRKVEDGRNFCNKLWNIARYIEGLVGDTSEYNAPKPVSVADHWIISKLTTAQGRVSDLLDKYEFSEAYETLYHFIRDDLADWYIEASKAEPNQPLLKYLLEQVLLVTHPFAPFVTETIWQTLAWEQDSILATRELPEVIAFNSGSAGDFTELQTIITESRAILRALNATGVTLYHQDNSLLNQSGALVKRLARLANVTSVKDGNGLNLTSTSIVCWLDIDAATAQAYAAELVANYNKQSATISHLEGRLSNDDYVKNAPKKLVDETKDQLAEAQVVLGNIATEQERFKLS
jgi:valyl-tRNA synthetase